MKKFTNAYQLTYDVSYEEHPYFTTTSAVKLTDLTNGAYIIVLKSNEDPRTPAEWEQDMIKHVLDAKVMAMNCGVYLTETYVTLYEGAVYYFSPMNTWNPLNLTKSCSTSAKI